MQYNRSLDGLRGVAVLFVVLFHFGYFTAGWIGVQIFFVLSGYLITSILVADGERSGLYFKRFYWRRSLRIFPLYFGYLMVLSLVFLLSGFPATFAHRWQYLYTYTYNYALLLVPLEQSPAYTHFWSLAVEEQFYLLWPLAVYYLSASSLKTIVAAALLVSPVVRFLAVLAVPALAPGHPEPGLFAYSPLPAQFDALATGAGLALMNRERIRRPLLSFGVLTVLALAPASIKALISLPDVLSFKLATWSLEGAWNEVTSLGYPPFATHGYQHVWSYSVINLWSVMLIAILVRGGTIATWLGRPFLVHTGKISYGLYVLHYPVLAVLKTVVYYRPLSFEGAAVFVVYMIALFGLATLSFRHFESRFLAWKDRRYTVLRPATVVST